MDIMPKRMPSLTGIKKAEIIAMFKNLWESAYKLSKAIEGHHSNAEGLLRQNEELRSNNDRLNSKINDLEDRIIALSVNTAKQHNRVNYGVRRRKIIRRERLLKMKRYLRWLSKLSVVIITAVLLYKYVLPYSYSVMLFKVIVIFIAIIVGMYIFDKIVGRVIDYLSRFWRR